MAAGTGSDPRGGAKTTLERTSDREIVISRFFRGPARTVFDAWTKAELVRRWWAPASRGVTMSVCEADVRVGGTYRYVLDCGPGGVVAFSGRYVEIEPPTRLVYTQVFEAFPGPEAMVTVTFEERDGFTRMVSRELYPSKEALEGALASGMEEGVRQAFEQLDELLASL